MMAIVHQLAYITLWAVSIMLAAAGVPLAVAGVLLLAMLGVALHKSPPRHRKLRT